MPGRTTPKKPKMEKVTPINTSQNTGPRPQAPGEGEIEITRVFEKIQKSPEGSRLVQLAIMEIQIEDAAALIVQQRNQIDALVTAAAGAEGEEDEDGDSEEA